MKVTIPYCKPAYLSALTDLKKGIPCPKPQWGTLRARGWMDRDGNITPKGIEYLTGRGYS